MQPGGELAGARDLTLFAGEDDADLFERWLAAKGFRVFQGAADRPVATTFTARISGVCGDGFGFVAPTLRVDVFRADTGQRVWVARTKNNESCPNTFFRDASAELAEAWLITPLPRLDDPALNRKVE